MEDHNNCPEPRDPDLQWLTATIGHTQHPFRLLDAYMERMRLDEEATMHCVRLAYEAVAEQLTPMGVAAIRQGSALVAAEIMDTFKRCIADAMMALARALVAGDAPRCLVLLRIGAGATLAAVAFADDDVAGRPNRRRGGA